VALLVTLYLVVAVRGEREQSAIRLRQAEVAERRRGSGRSSGSGG
jgi:hypothetical protein